MYKRQALGREVLDSGAQAIAALPLAAVAADRALPLAQGVNPAWAGALQALREQAVQPVLGEDLQEITAAQWEQVKAALQPCRQWLAARPATPLDALSQQEVQALLDGGQEAALLDLIAQDESEKEHSLQAVALEKLIRLQRDLLVLLNNCLLYTSPSPRD